MRLERMLRHGTLYDVDILTDAMQANLGDLTFQVNWRWKDPFLMSTYGTHIQLLYYRKHLIELDGSSISLWAPLLCMICRDYSTILPHPTWYVAAACTNMWPYVYCCNVSYTHSSFAFFASWYGRQCKYGFAIKAIGVIICHLLTLSDADGISTLTPTSLFRAASCAVPLVYGSTQLYAKDASGKIVPWNPSGKLLHVPICIWT
jgi:hypothetical protein